MCQHQTKMCEGTGLTGPCKLVALYGLALEGKKRWCAGCGEAEGAVRIEALRKRQSSQTTQAGPKPSLAKSAAPPKKRRRPSKAVVGGGVSVALPPVGSAVECYFPRSTGGASWEAGVVSRHTASRTHFYASFDGEEWPQAVDVSSGRLQRTWR